MQKCSQVNEKVSTKPTNCSIPVRKISRYFYALRLKYESKICLITGQTSKEPAPAHCLFLFSRQLVYITLSLSLIYTPAAIIDTGMGTIVK